MEPLQASTYKLQAPTHRRTEGEIVYSDRAVTADQVNMSAEVEETLKRIQSHKGVVGVIVVNSEGIPIKSTLDNPTTIQYTGLISGLTDKARSVVRDLDPTNDLTFLRVRSKKHEIMIAPDKEYMLIVVQNTSE
ncbi:Dynein light chain roadblock-type 2 [Chionoecetes opilio]|uniref:Dynein light chain roadblock-type 2 n=1 Tax=Chionoecetes opilio TaxID=41210 RepID=A0A8J4YCS6_CHIOP|nr:Dynein light chain roadblock-type 2 [Chionoecetes opilio]